MRAISRKIVSCFMLCIFMLSLGTHLLNTKWLMHDFYNGHGRNTFGLLAEQNANNQAKFKKSKATATASKSWSNAEHRLLHSVDPAQPLLLTYASDVLQDTSPRKTSFSAPVTVISPADSEPPFRPPRPSYRA